MIEWWEHFKKWLGVRHKWYKFRPVMNKNNASWLNISFLKKMMGNCVPFPMPFSLECTYFGENSP